MSNYYTEEIYDLEKEIVQLKQKLNKAKEGLRFYAEKKHIITENADFEKGQKARYCLKEIEK